MSICSVLPVLSFGLGGLRPFSPLAGSFRCYVTLPHFCPRFLPGFANFLRFPSLAREVSGFVRIKKSKKFSPRRRAAQPFAPPGQKSFIHAEKPLCIVHNGFFLYPSPNAFSYSSILRFSSAQYRASSSDMSSRLRFCTTFSPSSLPPARSVVIRW